MQHNILPTNMSGKVYKIVDTLLVRLKNIITNIENSKNYSQYGVVFGFNSPNNEAFCLGCCATEEDISLGCVIQGAYCLGDEQQMPESSVIEHCAILSKSKKSGKLIVLQQHYEAELKVLLYDIKSRNLSEVAHQTVSYQEACSDLVLVSLNTTVCLKWTNSIEEAKKNVTSWFDELRKSLPNNEFLLDCSQFKLSNQNDLKVEHLYDQIEKFDELADVEIPANMRKKMVEKLQRKLKNDKAKLEFKLIDEPNWMVMIDQSNPTEPISDDQTGAWLPLQLLCCVQLQSQLSYLHKVFCTGLNRLLAQVESLVIDEISEKGKLCSVPQVFTFYEPSNYSHPITVVFSQLNVEQNFRKQRALVHQKYLIPMDRPTFKPANRFDAISKEVALLNVHIGLNSPLKSGKLVTVAGKYRYFHYNQHQINDSGWGCAYRSLQTIISWFQLQGYIEIDTVPGHTQIQQALVAVGDKEENFIGTSKWIGSQEVCYVLSHLYRIESKILFINSGAELANKARELIQHFENNGTPVMIGGGVLAHTIIGVHFDQASGDVKYLVLDPHYTGGEEINTIQKKGWCGWKNVNFWDKNSFYNLCLPQRPQTY